MEVSLSHIEQELKSNNVTLVLDALKFAKRFHATTSFMADTGIKEASEKVSRYNILMKEFPIHELLSSTDLPKIKESIGLIFTHINKKLRLAPYPIARALPLGLYILTVKIVSAISQDFSKQIIKVVGSRIFNLEYAAFEKLTSNCEMVFETWDEHLKEFINVAREMSRKRAVIL